MKKCFICLPLMAVLAGCGADGAPTAPTRNQETTASGVTVTGVARVGVTYTE